MAEGMEAGLLTGPVRTGEDRRRRVKAGSGEGSTAVWGFSPIWVTCVLLESG